MERMRWLTVILVSLLLAAGVLPAAAGGTDDPATAPSASPSASPPEPAVYPVFNYPQPGVPDPAINNDLVRLLDQVPSDADVTAAFFVIQPNYPVVDALINAFTRGARVKVVLDSGDGQSASTNQAVDETFARLAAALGNDPAATSYAVQCVLSCISKAPESINHNKFVAMSDTGDLSDVVFQSTANIRSDGSGDGAWNAAVVSSGNPQVYGSYIGYAADLAALLAVPDDNYHAVRPPTAFGTATPYFFPRTDGTDSVSQTLMNVDCSLAPTTVSVMASFFTRPKVRNRLNEMAVAGCGVRVIARTDTITREFCDSLLAPVDVRIADKPSVTAVGIHGKYLTVSGGFNGSPGARVVWVGSHNLTRNALVRNDETFLLVDDVGLHDAFVGNFDRIWADPSLTPGCGRAGGTSEEQIEEEANTEVTPLIKEQQTVQRRLPKRLKKRTPLRSTHTVEGQRLTHVATCRVKGTSQRLKKRKICRIVKPKSDPTLVLRPTKKQRRLKVRIVQSAIGSATLLPFRRDQDYAYKRPKHAVRD
jgi:phosphatidylserine/phosphatidylglycerophosphate/cardiolipin synthase-like enzyme